LFTSPRQSRSFIIRVWVEPREDREAPVIWRGMVEEVSDSTRMGDPLDRKAFRSLDDLCEFLTGRLVEMGIPAEQLRRKNP
jgi:hypothetical protein